MSANVTKHAHVSCDGLCVLCFCVGHGIWLLDTVTESKRPGGWEIVTRVALGNTSFKDKCITCEMRGYLSSFISGHITLLLLDILAAGYSCSPMKENIRRISGEYQVARG